MFQKERSHISMLEIFDIRSRERTVIKTYDAIIEAPNWTQDGRFLIYNSLGKLFSFDLSTGDIRAIPTGFAVACNNDHILSPDNQHIAISHHTAGDGLSRIYTLPRAGGEPRLVTPNGPSYLHGWSPDGRTLAYCAERDGQYDIYTISTDGGPEKQLTNQPGLDDGPEYTPDGRYIWFNSVRSGLMQLWRMRADGRDLQRMTHEEVNGWFPHISPDGLWVSYVAYAKDDVAPGDHPPDKHVEIRLMPAQGGPSQPLIKLFGGQGTMNVNSWSPDSKRLAFVSYKP